MARNYQWTISVQRELGRSWVTELAYVASHGTNLPFNFDANQVTIDKLSQSLALGDAARPFPQYQGLGSNSYNAISNRPELQRNRHCHD